MTSIGAHRSRGPVVRGLLAAGAGRALTLPVNAACSFLSAFLILRTFGTSEYALVALIWSIAALLPFGDLGLGAAIIDAASHCSVAASTSGDDHLRAVVRSSLRALCVASGLAVGLSFAMGLAGWWNLLLGVPDSPWVEISATCALALFGVNMPVSIGQRLLVGFHRTGTATALQGLGPPIAIAVTSFAVLVVGRTSTGAILVVCALPVGQVCAGVAQCAFAAKVSSIRIRSLASEASRRRLYPGSKVRHLAGPMLIVTLAIPAALQSDRLILSHVRDTYEVAEYSLGAQLYGPLWAVLATAGLSLWPRFAEARRGVQADTFDAFRRVIVGFTSAGLLCTVVMFIVLPVLDGIISDGKISIRFTTIASFGVLIVVQSAQLPFGMRMTDGPGLRFQAVSVVVMLLLNVPLTVFFAKEYGAAGPGWASAVSILIAQLGPQIFALRGSIKSSYQRDGS